jgi:hypothetical protein
MKYNWIVLNRLESVYKSGRNRQVVEVFCEKCGIVCTVFKDNVYTLVCPCSRRTTKVNLSGTRFGSLLCVSPAGYNSKKRSLWNCICDCGTECVRQISDLTTGDSQSCGCKRSGNYSQSAWRHRYSQYKNRAARKHLEFSLTIEEFIQISSSPCAYCGSSPIENYDHVDGMIKQRKNSFSNGRERDALIYTNGIDRVDNSKGYTLENSNPCCMTCNFAKRSMSLTEFLSWVHKVCDHYKGGDADA